MATSRYWRVGKTTDVWGTTPKCGSTSVIKTLPYTKQYTDIRKGDRVRILARDPRDRIVSAWSWFTQNNSRLKSIADQNDWHHTILMSKHTPLREWVSVALKYENEHWLPQVQLHPRWEEFEVIPLHKYDGAHAKKTREDNSWKHYYDEATLALVNEVYKKDLAMWEVVKDGFNSGARILL